MQVAMHLILTFDVACVCSLDQLEDAMSDILHNLEQQSQIRERVMRGVFLTRYTTQCYVPPSLAPSFNSDMDMIPFRSESCERATVRDFQACRIFCVGFDARGACSVGERLCHGLPGLFPTCRRHAAGQTQHIYFRKALSDCQPDISTHAHLQAAVDHRQYTTESRQLG